MRRLALATLILLAAFGGAVAWLRLTPSGQHVLGELRHRLFVARLSGTAVTRNIPVGMPDGVALATDVYLPDAAAGPLPTILVRLPYGKSRYWEARHWISLFGPAGYAVVVQDMRGRYRSGGAFAPWPNAAGDGTATIDWITAQRWSDGKVATIGCSALGESQIPLAARRPKALRAILPIGAGGAVGAAGGLHRYFGTFEGGVPLLAANFGWFLRHGGKTGGQMEGPEEVDFSEVLSSLPVHGMVARSRDDPTDFDWLLDHFEDAETMHRAGYADGTDHFSASAFLVDDWFDPNVTATLELARMMRRDGVLRHVRVGPGEHCDFNNAFFQSAVGDVPVLGQMPDTDAEYLAFANHILRGGPAPDLPRYRVYVVQEDVWLDTDDWPPAGAREHRLFLAGSHLSNKPALGNRSFRSDPADPVPTIGGAICCTGNPDLRTGPLDQRPIEGRADLLIYDGRPLKTSLRFAGPVSARLWISSDVPDADLVARLVDVAPDGRSIPIREGALRLRYREGVARPSLMQPGQVYEVRVDLGDIAWLVPKGHQLRLHLAGSSFPRLARNPQTAGDPNRATESRPGTITVHGGPEQLSSVSFFVLDDGPD